VRPGTHKGPTAPLCHPVPLHFAWPPPRASAQCAVVWGRAVIRDVVARGWVGGGWALVGARLHDAPLDAWLPQTVRVRAGITPLPDLPHPKNPTHENPAPALWTDALFLRNFEMLPPVEYSKCSGTYESVSMPFASVRVPERSQEEVRPCPTASGSSLATIISSAC